MGAPFLPYGKQCIDEDDIKAVANVLRSDFLTMGPQVEAFEQKLSKITGAKHAVVCSNGTTALHLAVAALGLGEGDAVIVPSMTFLATANAARYCGADVIFADVDPDTGLMRVEDVREAYERAGSQNVKAVFAVHLNGQSVDFSGIREFAREQNMRVVFDSCHALGGLYTPDEPIGSCAYSDMETFSFHPVKTIAMGEGGAITTNNDELAEKMKTYRNHGMTMESFAPDIPRYYKMYSLGHNFRASDMHCALGASQLDKLEDFVAKRSALVDLYDQMIVSLAPTVKPVSKSGFGSASWHLYPVLIDFDRAGISRAELMEALKSDGIGTQVHYYPIHKQPYYADLYGEIDLPGTDSYYRQVLSVPLYPTMIEEDVERVIAALKLHLL